MVGGWRIECSKLYRKLSLLNSLAQPNKRDVQTNTVGTFLTHSSTPLLFKHWFRWNFGNFHKQYQNGVEVYAESKSVEKKLFLLRQSRMMGARRNRLFSMENGEKYHFTCVHFSLFFGDEIKAIFGQIGKVHKNVWAYIFRNIGQMKTGSFFRPAPVYPVHASIIFFP